MLAAETCGEARCVAMSEIIYHAGTMLPDNQVGLCTAHNVQYTNEGQKGLKVLESFEVWDASNPTPENGKKKRGRPKKIENTKIADAVKEAKVEAQHVEGAAAPATVTHTIALPTPVDDGPAVPKMPVVLAFTTEAKTEAEATLGMLREVRLTTPEHESWAMNAANALAKKHDELEKKRKSWTAPLKKVTSDIESEFRPVLQLLTQGIDILKQKVGDYRFALEQEKRKALAAMHTAVQAGDTAQVQALATQIEISAPPPPDKGSVNMVWTGQVTNATEIPRQYLVPDVNALLTITASLKRDPGIPGWKAWEVPEVKISRR
jgi:hypothetical protein